MAELPVSVFTPEEVAKRCNIPTDALFSFGASGSLQFVFFSKGFHVEHSDFIGFDHDGSSIWAGTAYTYEKGFVPLHQNDVAAIWAYGQTEITRLAEKEADTSRRIINDLNSRESRSIRVGLAELRILKGDVIRFQNAMPPSPLWMTLEQVSKRWVCQVEQLLDLAIEEKLTLLFHCPGSHVELEMVEECDEPPYWYIMPGGIKYESGFLHLHSHSVVDLRHTGKAYVTRIADSSDGFGRQFVKSFYDDSSVGFYVETSGLRILTADIERFELEHNLVPEDWKESSNQPPNPIEKYSSPFLFRREGENWRVRFQGTTCGTFKDSNGLRIIAHLLQNPGRDFHVFDLRRIATPPPPVDESLELKGATRERMNEMGLSADGGGIDTVLDEQGMRDIKAKLGRLKDQIEDAEELGNAEKKARLEERRDELLAFYNPAVGRRGRPRKATDQTELGRKAVSMNIDRARKRIATKCPDLGNHLDNTIQTGTICAYRPDREISWSL